MGTKANPAPNDCYNKAEPDEPMFVLLARDPWAPLLVRIWAILRRGELPLNKSAEKADEAETCAKAMEQWRRANRP